MHQRRIIARCRPLRAGVVSIDTLAIIAGFVGLACIMAGIILSLANFLRSWPVPVRRMTAQPVNSHPADAISSACTAMRGPVFVPILMYHYVEHVRDPRDTIRISLDTYPETLERQVSTLKSAGYTFMTMSELTEAIGCRGRMPAKPILMTFDDGYRDFYTDVMPVLKREQVKATSYVISGFLGGANYMTENQVREVASSGLVEIGAHTVHHPSLARRPADFLAREIGDSRTQLERLIGRPVVSFCYPNGSYDDAAERAVAAAGFTSATTTKRGGMVNPTQWFAIGRIRPGANSGPALVSLIEQLHTATH
jgi:peptidoglycan/xylan/chitin deacetylase (PgdA/CDA1 family)